jgi:hypothetical protein
LSDSIRRGRQIQVLVVPYGSSARERALLQEYLVRPSLGRYYKDDVADEAKVKKFICAFQ